MQCKNGGWAAFDKDNTKMIFQYIPFADHNAMLDPPTVDITGRILEMLAHLRLHAATTSAWRRRSSSSCSEQEPDGSWFGRWGVNYIYGTFLVLRGLEAMGVWNHEPRSSRRRSGFAWCRIPMAAGARPAAATTTRLQRGIGPSTPSQTAWAVLGLLAAGDTRCDSVAKGVRWLLDRQHEDGTWDESGEGTNGEAIYTGTGFPARLLSRHTTFTAVLSAAGPDDLQAGAWRREAAARLCSSRQ